MEVSDTYWVCGGDASGIVKGGYIGVRAGRVRGSGAKAERTVKGSSTTNLCQ